MNAILLASAGVVVLLVGGGLGFWVGRSGIGGSKARVEKAEADLEEYKRSVTEHFGRTAAHFQAIGKQYRELYEHMANGAQALCEPGETGQQLLFARDTDEAATNVQEPTAETVEAAAESADEPVTEIASAVDSTEAVTAEENVDDSVAESQPETKAEVGEQTLH